MGKMILGVHIDLAKHIFDTIDSVAKNSSGRGGFPFGRFITYYLLKNGVKEKENFTVINSMDKISPASTRRSRGQLKRLEAPTLEIGESSGRPLEEEGRPSQESPLQDTHPQGPKDDYSLRGLYELVRGMQEKHETILEESLKKLQERQEAIFVELKV